MSQILTKILIVSYIFLFFYMILLIFYEIMYVFLKKQIFRCHFFIKTRRIMKIIKFR